MHLGMATQTDAGLTVPVIRDAQDRNVWQLASEITRLAEAARINLSRRIGQPLAAMLDDTLLDRLPGSHGPATPIDAPAPLML
ncbi:2-oxo acid dehydrogenase subunit E2, partial [Halomonas sp. ND22Bw]|uniref:2-oxo acid dehydrogenase subunit E2 n=1 Tax=Halomonas sp. ND22Bw TaxID=2054178 RepID=UPI0034E0A375